MGYAMVQRLLTASHDVHVWNRTRAKAQGLTRFGATIVDTVAELAGLPAASGCGSPVKRCTPTPKPASGSDSHCRSKPRSSNHSQISGTRSGAPRWRVQMTVPPVLHNWEQESIVRSMSSSEISPNTPQTSTRSSGTMSR
jgi:hypothetical protein